MVFIHNTAVEQVGALQYVDFHTFYFTPEIRFETIFSVNKLIWTSSSTEISGVEV